jgi:N6-adenosine-specific RNA methylase IME4
MEIKVTSSDNCLIGLKKSNKRAANLQLKFTPEVDVLFEDSIGSYVERPEKFYNILDSINPEARKLQFFSRSTKPRSGWVIVSDHVVGNLVPFENHFFCECNLCGRKIM